MVVKTRDKLIEVARQLFANKGVENTTMDDIANASAKGRRTIYTYFKNTVTFEPRLEILFPVEKGEGKLESKQEILFEPNANEILNTLIPMALKSTLYSLWMETKTSEQASRRLAMENATDNAEELKEKLVLQFNQARQAAITQEITEIVAGADSL